MTPTPADFRAAGITADAINHPHSPEAFAWLCRFNGVREDQAPPAWRYASSAVMQAYIQGRATA